MITTEAQLQQTLEQIARMYRVLRLLKEDEPARGPVLYAVMAEGPLDMVRELQRDVEAYVGVTELAERGADVWIRIHGPDIAWEDAPTRVITSLLDALRKGVQTVAAFIDAGGGGSADEGLLEASDLRLVAFAPGSVQVGLRLPDEPDEGSPGGSKRRVVEEALSEYVEVASWAAEEGEGSLEEKVPDPQRRRVLINALEPLLPRKRGSVDFVEIRAPRLTRPRVVRLTREAHQRLDRALDRLVTERVETRKGVLREIDLDACTFLLRESGDAYRLCSFGEELYETAKTALDRPVEVHGTLRLREGRRGAVLLYATRLEILDEEQGEDEPGGTTRERPSAGDAS